MARLSERSGPCRWPPTSRPVCRSRRACAPAWSRRGSRPAPGLPANHSVRSTTGPCCGTWAARRGPTRRRTSPPATTTTSCARSRARTTWIAGAPPRAPRRTPRPRGLAVRAGGSRDQGPHASGGGRRARGGAVRAGPSARGGPRPRPRGRRDPGADSTSGGTASAREGSRGSTCTRARARPARGSAARDPHAPRGRRGCPRDAGRAAGRTARSLPRGGGRRRTHRGARGAARRGPVGAVPRLRADPPLLSSERIESTAQTFGYAIRRSPSHWALGAGLGNSSHAVGEPSA